MKVVAIAKYYCTSSSDTLIIIQLGGNNDMFNGENKTAEVTENAKKAVISLAQRGARKVLALNLADLSKAPGVPSPQAGQFISALVSETNTVGRFFFLYFLCLIRIYVCKWLQCN